MTAVFRHSVFILVATNLYIFVDVHDGMFLNIFRKDKNKK